MKINSIFSIFTPKDVKFFPLLKETAEILAESGNLIEILFTSPSDHINDLCHKIKEQESKGDAVAKKISKALIETFITPFDREDIHALSDVLDDVIDSINRSAQKLQFYEPKILPDYMAQMATIVKRGTEETKRAIDALPSLKKNSKDVRTHCKEMKRLESEADVIYEKAIIKLFHEDITTVELIKLKEILFELEMSINKVNSTAKILKTIVIKYA